MGYIKKLYQNCLVGVPGSEGATEIYPVTSTLAVYDQTGENNLDDYIPIKTSTPVYIKYSDLAEAQSIIVSAWGSAETSTTFLINIWRDEVGILRLNQVGPIGGLYFYKETISHNSETFDVFKISLIEDTLPPYTINIVSFNGKKVPLYSLEETDIVENSEMLSTDRLADQNYVDSHHDSTKQDTLTFDDTPTAESDNPVKSSGIKTYVDSYHDSAKQDIIPTLSGSTTLLQTKYLVIPISAVKYGFEIVISRKTNFPVKYTTTKYLYTGKGNTVTTREIICIGDDVVSEWKFGLKASTSAEYIRLKLTGTGEFSAYVSSFDGNPVTAELVDSFNINPIYSSVSADVKHVAFQE